MYSLILHGRRLVVELQKCHHLRASSVSLFQNASAFSNSFSSASVAADVSPKDGQKGQNFTVFYLVDSLGLTTKLARSISRRLSFEDKGNPDSVLSLFRSHGFTDSQISTIVTDYPRFLIADAEKSLAPKLRFLQSRGASTSELTEIVSTVPKILGIKKNKAISVYYDFVKEIVEADKSSKLETLCHSSLPHGSRQDNKIRNVLVLRELGVPLKLLLPWKEKFEDTVKKVVGMSFDPTNFKFVQALNVVYKMSDTTIQEKINAYKSVGFAAGDVWEMFKKWPLFLTFSEKKISQTFETLKKFGLVEDEILSVFKKFPQCISYSEQKIETSIQTFLGLGFSRDGQALSSVHWIICRDGEEED